MVDQEESHINKNTKVHKILHLSMSDVNFDSRILKSIAAGRELGVEVVAIGCLDYLSLGTGVDKTSTLDNVKRWLRKKRIFRPLKIIFNWSYFIKHWFSYLKLQFRIYKKIRETTPSVVHCHDWHLLACAVLAKFGSHYKILYDAHELESATNGLSRSRGLLITAIERLCWSQIDFFITVNISILDWYESKYSKLPSAIVMNSPEYALEKEKSLKGPRELFEIPKSAHLYVYVGYFYRGRGIELALDAFSRELNKSYIVFLGEGPLETEIQEKAQKSRNIFMHPMIEHSQVVPWISEANFGLCLLEAVSLSDYYSLPNKFFEYAFADLTILASKFPELDKLVKKHNLGQIIDNSSNALYSELTKNESNYEMHRKPIDLDELSWWNQKEKLKQAYKYLFN